MAFYIKVTKQVAKRLGHGEDRNTTFDGNKLLWQADIARIEGDTIFEQSAKIGGVALTSFEAKAEIDGVDNPAEVTTPEEYMETGSVSENNSVSENESNTVIKEEVIS